MTFSMRRASFTVTPHLLIFTSSHLEIGKKDLSLLLLVTTTCPHPGHTQTEVRKLQVIDFCRSIGIEWGI